MEKFFGLGAAFYPEHHPRKTWPEYIDLMVKAGIRFVRLGEFAWDKLEPEEGRYDFDWLDDVLSLLARRHINVLMCTPSAVPPIWACRKYPEIHPVLKEGKVLGFGIRRYTCPTSPAYHELCDKIVTEQARRYASCRQVIGWQIDNELGHPFCFCPRCLNHFQEWCEQKFRTIQHFNDVHETHFLGQTLGSFDQIPFPNTYPSPSLWMSYHKFHSDMTIACFQNQIRRLRSAGVKAPITTNMMGTWYGYNHEEMARQLDVVSADHYSMNTIFGSDFEGEAFVNAYFRGLKGGQNIWYAEFQCARGHNNYFPLPGRVRWYSLVQVGLGADLLNYFRWDTCPSGCERDANGLLKPCRQPGRVFQEIKKLSNELGKIKPVLDGTAPVKADVAVLYTYENHYDFAEQKKLEEFSGIHGNGYALHLAKHIRAMAGNNIPVDIVYPGGDFSQYKFIIAPALYILPESLGQKISAYIKNGGNFLLTCFSGIADENAKVWDIPTPGPLGPVCGVRILDSGAYYDEMGELHLDLSDSLNAGHSFMLRKWMDEIIPDSGVEILATYSGKYFNGTPAFTKNRFGKGAAYYLGVILEDGDYSTFYRSFLGGQGIKPLMVLPDGVHVSCRAKKGLKIYFISNETGENKTVNLVRPYTEVRSGRKIKGEVSLAEFDVLVLKEC